MGLKFVKRVLWRIVPTILLVKTYLNVMIVSGNNVLRIRQALIAGHKRICTAQSFSVS